MDNVYLEYQESSGNFHYNEIFHGQPRHQLNTSGYATISFTSQQKASLFCNIMQKKNTKYFMANQKYLSLATMKEEWCYFSFIFDYILHRTCILKDPKYIEFVQSLKDFEEDKELDNLNNI